MDLEQAKARFEHAGNEGAILACVCKDISLYYEVEARLRENDFLTAHNRAIWVIVRYLVRQGVSNLDTTAILNQARSLKLEEKIGGYAYVSSLFDRQVDPTNIGFYISRVADGSSKLKILLALDEMSEMVDKNRILSNDTLPAEAIVDAAQQKFLQIALESRKMEDASNIGEGADELLAEAISRQARIRGVESGFPLLDQAINGFEPGTLTVVGARPKTGKSAWLLNVAKHLAYVQRVPVLYLDTEMNRTEQFFRLMSILSGVPERLIKNGTYKEDPSNDARVEEAKKILDTGLILHRYFPEFTAESISSLARKYQHQYGIGGLIFDYIKLPEDDLQRLGNVKEYQSLGFLCVSLKNLAGELSIPVITAAQIGRGGANKGRVTAADFADSDRILRYANTLLGLSAKTKEEFTKAEERFGREISKEMGSHRLQILNTRAGGENFGGIDLYFRREILTMREAREQERDHLKSEGEDSDFE